MQCKREMEERQRKPAAAAAAAAAAGRAHLGGQSLAQSGCAVRQGCPAPLNEGEAQAGGQRHERRALGGV